MWLRILIAGIVGGILVFVMGATNHMVFQLLDRTFKNVPESATFIEHLKTRNLDHGFYVFPDMPAPADHSDEAKMAAFEERYAAGPSGFLLIVHKGKMLMGEMLGKELASNIIAALMASWVISLAGPDVGFGRRWFAIVLIGLVGWFSIIASYGIWYRFPHDFVHDELLCVLLEWSVAGLAIAAIVRRKPAPVATP